MIPILIAITLLIALLVTAGMEGWNRKEGARAREVLLELAPRIGAAPRISGESVLPFERRGFPGALTIRIGHRYNVEAAFHLQGEGGGWVSVSSLGLKHAFFEQFGANDFQAGDPEFDELLEVWASDPGWALQWLRPELRRLILQLERRWHFFLRLTPDQLVIRARIRPVELHPVDTFAGIAFQILDLLDLPSPEEFVLSKVKEVLDAETRCPVCGSPLVGGRVVRCAKCRALHHADCWQFNGLCATFACGSRVLSKS